MLNLNVEWNELTIINIHIYACMIQFYMISVMLSVFWNLAYFPLVFFEQELKSSSECFSSA